jgi:hypothetical protein
MKITVQITIQSDQGQADVVQEVAQLERGPVQPETLGLSLAEARAILAGLERTMAEQQVAEFTVQEWPCPCCGRARACKDRQSIVYRTPFGKLKLESPRLYRCRCESKTRASFSPLVERLPERTSPELTYLETKFSALVSYGLSLKLLEEVLPIGQHLSGTALQNRVRRMAERLEGERAEGQGLFLNDNLKKQDRLPQSGMPLAVGLDGCYVHAKDQPSRAEGWFEVIVGKSLPSQEQASRCFAWVSRYDPEPKRRVFEFMESQGLQRDQPVTFLSDGGDTVRELPRGLHPQAEYLLDWFHLTMRLTVMSRVAKGVREADQPDLSADLEEMLEHLKWNLWHGKVDRALEITDEIAYALDVEGGSPEHRKLLKAVRAFETYVRNNRALIPDYGQRYRQGQVISTAFVESAVNQVVSTRFVKKQQMRWTPAGAHLLLQVRTQVLNETWRATLSRWYPSMRSTPKPDTA